MSSTNFGSIIIVASCVVGTCNIVIYCVGEVFKWGGSFSIFFFFNIYTRYMFCFFSTTVMVGVGIFTLGGEF